mgnify:CR=1 FL=1
MKHTPGSWETSSNADNQWDVCMEGAGDMIADLSGCNNQEANACLIAAAPQLLEELDDVAGLLDDIEHGYSESNPKLAERAARASAKARAIIAKATGEA